MSDDDNAAAATRYRPVSTVGPTLGDEPRDAELDASDDPNLDPLDPLDPEHDSVMVPEQPLGENRPQGPNSPGGPGTPAGAATPAGTGTPVGTFNPVGPAGGAGGDFGEFGDTGDAGSAQAENSIADADSRHDGI
jgi:hypothetical protein